ncbi:MAG: DNA polymerase I [Chloroflexi bacterium GWC2_73_18]|nr:MAG: DNA polymerase I [Chloroflexi bacterium GWC2_73_18]
MLLDGNGLIYRGYFALPPLTTSRGELVNAVFGFCQIVLRGFQDVRPDYVAVSFDLSGPTFRHERFADYKAQRQRMPDDLRDQFPRVRAVVAALGIPVYELQGYEADDLIGTLSAQAEARGLDTTIVTGDLDMLQLVDERIRLMTTRSGVQNTVVYDPAMIRERYGLEPGQMIDFKALKGDATDNIPGVPGVGEKTAAKLLQRWGSVAGIYEGLEAVTPDRLRELLREHRAQVEEARELATIHRDLPVALDLEAARHGDYDRGEVIRLFREFEFRTLIERLPPLHGEAPPAPGDLLREADAGQPIHAVQVDAARRPQGWGEGSAAARRAAAPARPLVGEGSGLQLTLDFDAIGGGGAAATAAVAVAPTIEVAAGDPRGALVAALADPGRVEVVDAAGARTLVAWLAAQPGLTVASVSDDPRPRRGRLLALAVAGADGRAIAAADEAAPSLLDAAVASGRPLLGHEVKRVLVAHLAAVDPDGRLRPHAAALPAVAFDTQIAAYLLNAALRSQTLGDIAAERLGLEISGIEALAPGPRAGVAALAAAAARGPLAEALGAEGLDRLFAEVELPLIAVLASMEAVGVRLDDAALAGLAEEFGQEIARLETEIYTDVGHEFNLGSPKQLEQVLFHELDLPRGKRTKTGYSTDASVLEELRPAHPAIGKLLDWRLYSKLKSTYVDALPALVDPATGRLHTTFHQAVAATGRLSSSDPNLQNIPIRTRLGRRIRRAFVAGAPDLTLLAADYSQIELRILAHVSGDENLKDAFARKVDIHRETAARVLHKPPESVTGDERSMAKMVNFGIAYGMSDFGLSTRASIPREEAQAFINTYFATYSGISYYMLHIKELARQQRYVTTLLGRRRWIPELEARNSTLRAAGERMAINMPIQGTAADIIKIAMNRLAARLHEGGFRARSVLQVHDELLLEVPRDELAAVAPIVRQTMETALPLDVPLDVDLKAGDDWESMTPLQHA